MRRRDMKCSSSRVTRSGTPRTAPCVPNVETANRGPVQVGRNLPEERVLQRRIERESIELRLREGWEESQVGRTTRPGDTRVVDLTHADRHSAAPGRRPEVL